MTPLAPRHRAVRITVRLTPEDLLEAGLALVVGLLLGIGVLLGVSRAVGGAQRWRRYRAKEPAAGEVPPSRHQGVGVAPASS